MPNGFRCAGAVWGWDVCSGRGEFMFGVSDWDVLELVGIDVSVVHRRIGLCWGQAHALQPGQVCGVRRRHLLPVVSRGQVQ